MYSTIRGSHGAGVYLEDKTSENLWTGQWQPLCARQTLISQRRNTLKSMGSGKGYNPQIKPYLKQ